MYDIYPNYFMSFMSFSFHYLEREYTVPSLALPVVEVPTDVDDKDALVFC